MNWWHGRACTSTGGPVSDKGATLRKQKYLPVHHVPVGTLGRDDRWNDAAFSPNYSRLPRRVRGCSRFEELPRLPVSAQFKPYFFHSFIEIETGPAEGLRAKAKEYIEGNSSTESNEKNDIKESRAFSRGIEKRLSFLCLSHSTFNIDIVCCFFISSSFKGPITMNRWNSVTCRWYDVNFDFINAAKRKGDNEQVCRTEGRRNCYRISECGEVAKTNYFSKDLPKMLISNRQKFWL